MTKAPTLAEMSNGQSDNTKKATKNFDYTAVADRLRTASWSNYGHPTGVVYRFYLLTLRFHLLTHRNSCVIEDKNMQILLYSDINLYTFIIWNIFKWYDCVTRQWKNSIPV